MIKLLVTTFASLSILSACSNAYDATFSNWQHPVQPCRFQTAGIGDQLLEIKHETCVMEVDMIDTINTPRCVRCDHTEINPRKIDDRNDQERMR